MDGRHKTQKRLQADEALTERTDTFKNLLEESAREAYSRPWHRLERGLRLNRIRMFIEENSSAYSLSKEEKEELFLFLQKTHDKKLLNTTKIVNYDVLTQKIDLIRGLDIKRMPDGRAKWGFSVRKTKLDSTRKRRRDEILNPEPVKPESGQC